MIVLDASVAIALLDRADAHHEASVTLLRDHLGDRLAISTLTLAEVLVRPARVGDADRVESGLRALGVSTLPLAAHDALALARTRAATGLRMPDAVVVHTAQAADAAIATADRTLADAARRRGLAVLEA
ncbi:PIN domain-containing protein [Microbacterium thalassium]|uniref:Ribonuclease VapC n=1 Tax=Microbacterium thalassium TaxID=362649 RepID=A0A7X0KVY7_9MICO|nr:PIN domain-containing protein [Microbacterium thalassium]MBB6392746.1 putative nucleic acid-binding protein [Microbacterium thalassium]GLK23022.1 hypothetical protein GCM10017607_03400 [Microbacterium thalassium]